MTEHTHGSPSQAGNKLKYGIMLTGLILVIEVAGGIVSNSLALLSDAGHVLTDIVALSLSWYGVRQAGRPPSSRMTYGYHRVGVIIALVNVISIFAIAAVILYESYRRWQQPPEVNSPLMLAVAVIGLVVNLLVARWLSKEQQGNLNVRSAFWHALGDALASVGVIIGGLIILFTGLFIVDPIVSVFISLIIVVAAWRILKEGLKVLLEATPLQVDVSKMIRTLERMRGIKGVHDVHVWSISPEIHAMSCHVVVDDLLVSEAADIRRRIEEVLRQRFHIEHTVLQMECPESGSDDTFCKLVLGPGPEETGEHHHE